MYALGLTVVMLCVLPGSIGTGQSSWCDVKAANSEYSQAPADCCKTLYDCSVSIEPQSSMYGITNTGTWRLRLCSCDLQFNDCLLNKMPRADAMKAIFGAYRHSCMDRQTCPNGEQCKIQYNVVNFGHWVQAQN